MHKTFYIDIDEEVTSIIDRLRKSPVKENILVIPQRSLILQSIVNLKLLEKEATKNKKQIMIVTQDSHGQALVEKAGILVQSSMEGIEEDNVVREDFEPKINDANTKDKLVENMEKKEKLKRLGSGEFFDISSKKKINNARTEITEQVNVKKSDIFPEMAEYNLVTEFKAKKDNSTRDNIEKLDSKREKELEKLFGKSSIKKEEISENVQKINNFDYGSQNSDNYNKKVSRRVKKIFSLLGIVCFFSILAVAAYLFLPKVDVEVYPQTNIKEDDLEIIGVSDGNFGLDEKKLIVSSRVVEANSSAVFSFDATGQKDVSDQKAHGTVVIYNEYSTASQQLVATTRLLTEDGKLFRLVAGVVVPGTSEIEGSVEPGKIEAEVVADQSGEEYNIEESKFSIVGFKGGPKYEKIYARSIAKMIGGGGTGEKLSSISEEDVKLAKQKTEESARGQLMEKIKGKLEEEEVILDASIKEDIVSSAASPGEGMVADSFNYQVDLRAKAIVVSQKKIDELVAEYFLKKIDSEMIIAQNKIEYGNIDADFEKNSIIARVHAKSLFQAKIDEERLKAEILGKSTDHLKEIINEDAKIKKIEMIFYPDFLRGRIPSQGRWVNLETIKPILE